MKNVYPSYLVNLPAKLSRTVYTFIFILFCGSCAATNFTVSNTNDAGAGSLRQAMTDALAAGAGSHTITANITGTISLQSALPTLTNTTVTINGPAAGTLIITRGSATAFRIFNITNGSGAATVTLNRLTMTNGLANAAFPGSDGGGISAISSSLTVNNCTITGCTSGNEGGAISITGLNLTLVVNTCTLAGNTAGRGGGISAGVGTGSGTATISNTTISGNTATAAIGSAGGVQLTSITATLTNCTISGNTASTSTGGGITTSTTTTLIYCTIANNTSGSLGGGMRTSTTNALTLTNTLLVNNTSSAGSDDINYNSGTGTKTFTSSVVGVLQGTGTYTNTGSTVGTAAAPAVVNLGPLANNGGPTFTRALLPSTPELAIDKGRATAPATTTDQRLLLRVIDNAGVANAAGGDGSDIGAFEAGNFVAPVTLVSFTGTLIKNDYAQLDWQVAQESNMSRYEIEWSTNGTDFTKIGSVAAANAPILHAYSFTHDRPGSINFYRLKIFDLDGSFEYSRIVIIKKTGSIAILISPNPVKDILRATISGGTGEEVNIIIEDASGKIWAAQKIILGADAVFERSIKNLSAGKYYFIVRGKNSGLKAAFIK